MSGFVRRVAGAAMLDIATYEEVEADANATSQAFTVVLLSSAAAGVGMRGFGASDPSILATAVIVAILAWSAWALLTFQIGARFFPEPQTKVDVGELLRTIGFASAPGILRVFGVLPRMAGPVFVLTAVWMLLAMIVAVRQALDYNSTLRAVLVCLVGWATVLAVLVAFGLTLAPRVS